MPVVEIRPGIYWIGVNDRTTDLFEGLWPISQEGVSYNAYLVNDEQKATTVKLHDPVRAIDLLNKMDHIYEPGGTTNILNQIINVNVVSESARKATERIVQGERTE